MWSPLPQWTFAKQTGKVESWLVIFCLEPISEHASYAFRSTNKTSNLIWTLLFFVQLLHPRLIQLKLGDILRIVPLHLEAANRETILIFVKGEPCPREQCQGHRIRGRQEFLSCWHIYMFYDALQTSSLRQLIQLMLFHLVDHQCTCDSVYLLIWKRPELLEGTYIDAFHPIAGVQVCHGRSVIVHACWFVSNAGKWKSRRSPKQRVWYSSKINDNSSSNCSFAALFACVAQSWSSSLLAQHLYPWKALFWLSPVCTASPAGVGLKFYCKCFPIRSERGKLEVVDSSLTIWQQNKIKQANTKPCKSLILIGLLGHLSQSFFSLFPVAKVSINLRFNDSEPGGVGNRSWKWAGKVVPCGRVRDLCDPFVSFCVPSPFAIDL